MAAAKGLRSDAEKPNSPAKVSAGDQEDSAHAALLTLQAEPGR